MKRQRENTENIENTENTEPNDYDAIVANMSVQDIFKLRTAIRNEQYKRWDKEITLMISTLPEEITSKFGIDDKWTSKSTSSQWEKDQSFKNFPTWFELTLFLAMDSKHGFGDGKISDDIWRIEIKGNTEDGAKYYTPEKHNKGLKGGDKIVIEFKYLRRHRYYNILTLYRLTESNWFTTHHPLSEHTPETNINEELYAQLTSLFTEKVLDFWKNSFNRIMYGE
jgi:hypothetical protein